MALRQPGYKPLSEPMMVSLLTHICITRPQWVKVSWYPQTSCSAHLKKFSAILFFSLAPLSRNVPLRVWKTSWKNWTWSVTSRRRRSPTWRTVSTSSLRRSRLNMRASTTPSRPSLGNCAPQNLRLMKSHRKRDRYGNNYCKISNIRRTKSQNLTDSRLVLQLCLSNPLKPSVKSRMKM